eukprot:1040505-Amphidinium_carterae.1
MKRHWYYRTTVQISASSVREAQLGKAEVVRVRRRFLLECVSLGPKACQRQARCHDSNTQRTTTTTTR